MPVSASIVKGSSPLVGTLSASKVKGKSRHTTPNGGGLRKDSEGEGSSYNA